MRIPNHNLPSSTLRVCTDRNTGHNKMGRAYCKLFPQCIQFQDLGELLLKADELFDEAGHPQAFCQGGTFYKPRLKGANANPKLYWTEEGLEEKKGEVSTSHIIVYSRRRAGWQGIYLDCRGRPKSFESEIELLKHMSRDGQYDKNVTVNTVNGSIKTEPVDQSDNQGGKDYEQDKKVAQNTCFTSCHRDDDTECASALCRNDHRGD